MPRPLIAWRRVAACYWLSTAAVLAGCIDLAPRHQRPAPPVPSTWRDAAATVEPSALPAASAGTLGWNRFIADERLRRVVALAVEDNRDLRIAVLNVEKARALYRIQDAARLPAANGDASASRVREAGATTSSYSASLDASYEIDLFGRLRNLSDAAVSTWFATREQQRAAQVLLVSEVATAWLGLAADLQRLALSRQTFAAQQRSYDLAAGMRALGASTGLAVAQARSALEAARVQVAANATQVGLDRNALELLVGAPVDDTLLPDPRVPMPAAALFDVPPDLPSTVLVDRPDVRAAERGLEAADANIGAARAAFFPRIALTSSAGVASVAFDRLLRQGGGLLSFAPSVSVPIFDGGRNDATLAAARVDRAVAVANYEKSLQSAFRDVADVLAARDTLAERTSGQAAFVDALETSYRLSDAVFRQGGSGYLQVLDAQRSLYGAQQGLISLQLEEQTSRVALFKALGGGWNDGDAPR